MLVDSHAHWDFKDFDEERDALWQRAQDAGVRAVLTIGTQPQGWPRILEIADRYDGMFATIGVHPCDSASVVCDGLIERLCAEAAHPKVVGFGETGLDCFHQPCDLEHQKKLFEAFCLWMLMIIRHFIGDIAMRQHLANIHFAPLCLSFRCQLVDAGDHF